jgi:hypothetical protein
MDTCRAGRVHRRQHRGHAQSVRGCSPPGSHPPNCLRRPGGAWPGRRGAVSATRPPGCSASTAKRRARARAASRPPQPAALVLPRRWPAPVPFICATAVLRSPTVSVTNLACRQDSRLPIKRLLVLSQRSGPSRSDRPVRRPAGPCQRLSCRRPTGPAAVHGAASFPDCSALSGPYRARCGMPGCLLRVTGMPTWRARSDGEIEFSILPALPAGFGSA